MEAERDGLRALGHALRGERHARAGDVRAARLHYGRAVHYAERARFGGGSLEAVRRALEVARGFRDEVERAATPGRMIAAGFAGAAVLYALSPSSASPSSPSHEPGLRNIGNTCYMNAAIRCLLAVTEFEPQGLVERAYAAIKGALQEGNAPTEWQLDALRSSVNERKDTGSQFKTGCQEDMHEFMFAIVETEPGPFAFELVARITDSKRQKEEIQPATCLALQLGGPDLHKKPTSIVDLLSEYIKPEIVEGPPNMTRTMAIGKPQAILAVQLVRFSFEGDSRKNVRVVDFDETLDLGPYTVSKDPARYDLIAVAIHRGDSGSGHYWAFTKGKSWTKYDDEVTARADFARVRAEATGRASDLSTAYVLVYRAIRKV